MRGTRGNILRDRTGKRIGEIYHENNGTKLIRDASGRRVGEYDPSTNITRDASGQKVGEGDLLVELLKRG